MLKVRSSILLTLNVTEPHSAKIKIIQWTSTTWDLWNLMQVEALLTRSLSSPVYTFPFWGKVGRCLPSGCVVFCLRVYHVFFLKGIMCVANCLLWDIVECPSLLPGCEIALFLHRCSSRRISATLTAGRGFVLCFWNPRVPRAGLSTCTGGLLLGSVPENWAGLLQDSSEEVLSLVLCTGEL